MRIKLAILAVVIGASGATALIATAGQPPL
jgi:hypothetical protein